MPYRIQMMALLKRKVCICRLSSKPMLHSDNPWLWHSFSGGCRVHPHPVGLRRGPLQEGQAVLPHLPALRRLEGPCGGHPRRPRTRFRKGLIGSSEVGGRGGWCMEFASSPYRVCMGLNMGSAWARAWVQLITGYKLGYLVPLASSKA